MKEESCRTKRAWMSVLNEILRKNLCWRNEIMMVVIIINNGIVWCRWWRSITQSIAFDAVHSRQRRRLLAQKRTLLLIFNPFAVAWKLNQSFSLKWSINWPIFSALLRPIQKPFQTRTPLLCNEILIIL